MFFPDCITFAKSVVKKRCQFNQKTKNRFYSVFLHSMYVFYETKLVLDSIPQIKLTLIFMKIE